MYARWGVWKPFSLPYLYISNIYITFGILTVEFFDIVNLYEINNLVLQIELYLLLPFIALCVVKPYKMEWLPHFQKTLQSSDKITLLWRLGWALGCPCFQFYPNSDRQVRSVNNKSVFFSSFMKNIMFIFIQTTLLYYGRWSSRNSLHKQISR